MGQRLTRCWRTCVSTNQARARCFGEQGKAQAHLFSRPSCGSDWVSHLLQIKLDMLAHERTMPNHVMGTLKRHNVQEEDRRDKVKDKSDRATTEQVLDDRTRLVIFKLLKGNFFSEVRVSEGSACCFT